MSNNTKTFVSAFYETNKREFWLLIIFNILLGIGLNLYEFHDFVQAAIVILMALKNISFLRSASVMPSVASDFDRYSWKYFQGLPLSKEELLISLILSNLIVMIPGLVWLMSFYVQLSALFLDKGEELNLILPVKIFLCLIPILFLISATSLQNLITFPRKQYSKNDPKIVFLHKVKVMVLGATGLIYGILAYAYFSEWTGINLDHYVGRFFKFLFSQSSWWLVPVFIFAAVTNYFYTLTVWQEEKRSYVKIDWQPKRDFSLIALCVALVWVPAKMLDFFTPEEFVDGKIVNSIYKEDHAKVYTLVAQGEDVNQVNPYGYSPILIAAQLGELELFKFLELRGASLDALSKIKGDNLNSGLNVFTAAVKSGNEKLVAYLLKKGLTPNEINKHNKWYPIHYATNNCRPKIVDLLIEKKANLNVIDSQGRTALHIAAQNGCFASVALLLDAGIDTKIKDKNGKLAAQYADGISGGHRNQELAFYLQKRSRMPASK